jgi:hypothetical protein
MKGVDWRAPLVEPLIGWAIFATRWTAMPRVLTL